MGIDKGGKQIMIITNMNGLIASIDNTNTMIQYDTNRNFYDSKNELTYYKLHHIGYENVEVPEGIEPYKHCYTPEKGFYINPDWVEPTPPDPKNIYNVPDDIYHNIIDDYTAETLMQEV